MGIFEEVSKQIEENRKKAEEREEINRVRADKYISSVSEYLAKSIKATLAHNLKNNKAITYNLDLSKLVQVDRTITLKEYEDLVRENEAFEKFLDDLEDNGFEYDLKFEKKSYKLGITIEKE